MSDYGVPFFSGKLTRNKVVFKKGHRVDSITWTNHTAGNVLCEAAAYNTAFYFPENTTNHGGREEVFAPDSFYISLRANTSQVTPEFFARRGLVLRSNKPNVYATVVVSGVSEGSLLTGKE